MADTEDTEDADKKLEERISRAVNGATKKLRDQLAKYEAQLVEVAHGKAAPADKPEAQAAAQGEPPEYSRSLKEASERIARLEAENKAAKKQTEMVQAKQKRDRERGALTELARKRGVPEPLIRGFVALHHGEGTAIDSEEGDDGKAQVFVKAGDERQDLTAWADGWFKSDEGKHYIPARPAAGAGLGRSTNGATQAPAEMSNDEIGAGLLAAWSRPGS